MTHETYWENGERVQVYDPRTEVDDNDPVDSPTLVMMRHLLGFLKSSPNPGLTIDCLCLISGVCYDGMSMAEIARNNLVTRAAASRRCVDLCDAFGIEPTRAMRSRKGRENCRSARIEKVSDVIL